MWPDESRESWGILGGKKPKKEKVAQRLQIPDGPVFKAAKEQ